MSRRAYVPWLWLMPAGAILIPFFVLPLAIVLRDSFSFDDPNGLLVPAFTGANYVKVLSDSYYLTVFRNTLVISFVVVILALFLAYPFAILIARAEGRVRAMLLWFVYVPLYVSVIMRAFGWTVITADSGVINAVLLGTGVIHQPIHILFEASGMSLGMLHRYLPLMIIPTVSSLQKIDPAVIKASENLGARGWFTWRHVTLPLSIPGLAAGSQLVFAGVLSDYALAALLGSTRFQVTAPALYYEAVTNSSWALAGAMATIVLGFVVLFLVGVNLALRRFAPWAGTL